MASKKDTLDRLLDGPDPKEVFNKDGLFDELSSRFKDERIVGVLKEHEAGIGKADLCRKHGISQATFYNWKAKFGGLEVSEAKRSAPWNAELAPNAPTLALELREFGAIA